MADRSGADVERLVLCVADSHYYSFSADSVSECHPAVPDPISRTVVDHQQECEAVGRTPFLPVDSCLRRIPANRFVVHTDRDQVAAQTGLQVEIERHREGMAHIVVMQHVTKEKIDVFISDLKKSLK